MLWELWVGVTAVMFITYCMSKELFREMVSVFIFAGARLHSNPWRLRWSKATVERVVRDRGLTSNSSFPQIHISYSWQPEPSMTVFWLLWKYKTVKTGVRSVWLNICYIVYLFVLNDTFPQNDIEQIAVGLLCFVGLTGWCLKKVSDVFKGKRPCWQPSTTQPLPVFNWPFRTAPFPFDWMLEYVFFVLNAALSSDCCENIKQWRPIILFIVSGTGWYL